MNKEIEIILKDPRGNSEVEKYNNWLGKFTRVDQSRYEQAEETISKLEEESFEIISLRSKKNQKK